MGSGKKKVKDGRRLRKSRAVKKQAGGGAMMMMMTEYNT